MKTSYLRLLAIAALIISLSYCAPKELLYYSSPTLLPDVKKEMNTFGFWVGKITNPDKLILNDKEIFRLNKHIKEDLNLVKDISDLPMIMEASDVKKRVLEKINYLKKKSLFDLNGREIISSFYKDIMKNIPLSSLPSDIKIRYGLTVSYTYQRSIPTDIKAFSKPGNISFDKFLMNSLDIGTPVAVLLNSKDDNWLFCITPLSEGWIKKEMVAIGSKEKVENYINHFPFVIITERKGDIFLDPDLTKYYGFARMGTRFPMLSLIGSDKVEVLIPIRNKNGLLKLVHGYISKEQVSKGFLPYTQRNIIKQAFKLLNSPYGWGGSFGEQDCSRFIHEIFSTVGIILPRNSKAQAKVGRVIATFSKNQNIDKRLIVIKQKAIPGITILRLKGHIMLYLGINNNKPYVIHATWGYREHKWYKDIVRVTNRVVVSDLFLGKGSLKGSLIERIVTIRVLDKP